MRLKEMEIFFITSDGSYKFGEVNQKTIIDKTTAIQVVNGGRIIHTVKLNKNEKPIVVKRTNSKEGVIYLVGFHKNEKQELTLIKEDGEIVKERNLNHCFHEDVVLEDWQK